MIPKGSLQKRVEGQCFLSLCGFEHETHSLQGAVLSLADHIKVAVLTYCLTLPQSALIEPQRPQQQRRAFPSS